MLSQLIRLFSSRRKLGDPVLISSINDKLMNIGIKVNLMQPLDKARFVILDIETTGFHPKEDRIISLGAAVLEEGKLRKDISFNKLINPGCTIPDEIIELTGITNESVISGDNFFQVFNEFLDILQQDDILLAHNADFDIGFIKEYLRYNKVKFKRPVIDTLKVSYALHKEERDHTLDNLLKRYKIPPEGRHTALGDCILTGKLFEIFIRKLKENRIYTICDLYNFLHWQLPDRC